MHPLFEPIPDADDSLVQENYFGLTADEIRVIRESTRITAIEEISVDFDLDYDLVEDLVSGKVASLAGGCLKLGPDDITLHLSDQFCLRVLQTAELAMSPVMFERILNLNGIQPEDYYECSQAIGEVNEKWQYHKLIGISRKKGVGLSKE